MAKDKPTESNLRTPTDLDPKKTKAIAEAVNKVIASNFALYVKTKNFHWHMSGPHFRDYHLMLDDHGDAIFATIDPLAERVRKIGQNTLRSVGHIAKLSAIKDDDRDFVDPREMLLELMDDNKATVTAMREAHKIADDAEDSATTSLLEVYIDETERRTWFLFEAARAADPSGH